jgi:hypothetical protein
VAALDVGTVVEVLVAAGVFTGIGEFARWLFSGRGRARVDNAQIVQGMAIDLIQPLHTEMDGLRGQVDDLRHRADALRTELEQVLGYAILCHELLLGNPNAPRPPQSVLRKKPGI